MTNLIEIVTVILDRQRFFADMELLIRCPHEQHLAVGSDHRGMSSDGFPSNAAKVGRVVLILTEVPRLSQVGECTNAFVGGGSINAWSIQPTRTMPIGPRPFDRGMPPVVPRPADTGAP